MIHSGNKNNIVFKIITKITIYLIDKFMKISLFSEGSILVDYFVELANMQQKINTQDLKVIFHDSLRTYNTNKWNETKTKDSIKLGSFTIDPKYTDFVGMSYY